MRFKETYIGTHDSEVSLGKFYSSDIRKLVVLGQYYPFMFEDPIDDPMNHTTELVRGSTSLFFTMRWRNKVIGYTALAPILYKYAVLHCWCKKGVRVRKEKIIKAMRLPIEFGFAELKLHKVITSAPVEAKGINKVVREIGFVLEGVLRENAFFGGEPHDANIYGMLRRDLWQ